MKDKTENKRYTRHAAIRITQRRIPEAMVLEAIANGRKLYIPDRNVVEHVLKNVLGIRGADLVVVTSADDGSVVTSYVKRQKT